MRKIYKLGLSLGATTSIVAPITTVACDNKGSGDTHKPIVTPPTVNPDTSVTTFTPYSVDSLMKEANSIGWSKTDKFSVWKNGVLCESNSQFINMLIHLAKEYGYTIATNEFIITDAMVNDASKTTDPKVEDIANQIVSQHPNVANNDALKLLIKSFIAFKPAATVTDEAKLASNLTGGNQTYDNDNDLTRANLDFNNEVKELANRDQFDLWNSPLAFVAGNSRISTLQWYEGNNMVAIASAPIKDKSNHDNQAMYLTRKTYSKDLAVKYPVINSNDFNNSFVKTIKKLLEKIMNELGPNIDQLDVAGLNSAYYGAIKQLVTKFTKTDSAGNLVVDLPADFESKMQTINATGDINWIAVKAMYLGFDKTFQEQYPDLMSDNWANNPDTVGLGLMDTTGSQSAMGILTNMGGTSWAHTTQFNFNPTLSRDDNYKANNKTAPAVSSTTTK